MTNRTQPEGLFPRATLTDAQRDEMFALLSSHFEGVERGQFDRDLTEKNWVIEVRRDGRLLGFSTLLVCEEAWNGQALTVVYSGDTIVVPDAWNSPQLARTWIAAVNHLRETGRPCYWLLLTSGFRTYRFLPVFWREFFPHHDAATSAATRDLLVHLARSRYGDSFDEARGVVRFAKPQHLRGKFASLPEDRAGDPHVAFFLSQNPGHADGDELVCLTEISAGNLTAAGRRMIAK